MIEVWLDRTALTVRGHAGFSRYGSDIVCAAASMLAFALAEAVQAAGMKTPPVIESGCGRFRLEAFADGQEQARLDGMFETVRAGYRLLSARYPDYVRVWVNVTLKISWRDPSVARLKGRRRKRMKNFDWLQAFAMEQQEQPEPGVSADAAPQDEQERAEAFRALILGPYKKDYDRQVQMIVRERLKNCARSEQVLKSLGPALEKTFGVDAAQLTPEQAERLAACAPEGKVPVTKEQREEAMRQGYEALREQFAAVREAYPGAQLHEELESPVFMRLVMRGVDARSAYELTHLRELRAGAMAYGARRAREELTAAMQAGYLRPRESGMAPAAGGAFAESPEHWSRQTREELKARARRGETVRL